MSDTPNNHSKPKLEVIQGSRRKLELKLVETLFTEFGASADKKVDALLARLKRQGKLSLVMNHQSDKD